MKLTLPRDPNTSDSICADGLQTPDCHDDQSFAAHAPELLLVCEAWSTTLTDGYWRFTLETAEGESIFDAEDQELGDLNRLTLLAAVRGLEAVEGRSSITLVSNNRYLIRSLTDSLPRWRANDFVWDHFGRHVDVQHADLWRRIDRALSIHRVEACLVSRRLVSAGTTQRGDAQIRIDSPHSQSGGIVPAPASSSRGRMRNWLLGGVAAPTATGRFIAHDLVESA